MLQHTLQHYRHAANTGNALSPGAAAAAVLGGRALSHRHFPRTEWLNTWLADWLTDWLTVWLADWLIALVGNWLTDWLTGVMVN